MARSIPLTQGLFALVDDEDFDRLNTTLWRVQRTTTGGGAYATASDGRRMHRDVLHAPDGAVVDHINHNTLDNRKANLRLVNHAGNNRNARKQAGTSSQYKGVAWNRGAWQAIIADGDLRPNGKRRLCYLGRFDSETDAALAYDAAARDSFGALACVNFPRAGEQGALTRSRAIAAKPGPTRMARKQRNTSSHFLGVSRHKQTGKWTAQIRVGGRLQHLGLFASETDAALAYDAAARLAFGDRARPNFGAAGLLEEAS